MRFRWLAVFPLLYAAVFIAVAWWLRGGEALAPFTTGQRLLVRLLAIAGRADHFNIRLAAQQRLDASADKGLIVDDQDANFGCHRHVVRKGARNLLRSWLSCHCTNAGSS